METYNKIVAVVDLETTGPSIEEGDRIIQIGAVLIKDGEVIARHSMLINPEREIPLNIIKLTGITNEKVRKAPTFKQVVPLWYERLHNCIFVAHNIGFDLRFLQESFQRFGYEFEPLAMDTAKLAKILLPTAAGFNLTDLSQHFQLDFEDVHDALSDAIITTQILSEMSIIIPKIPPPVLQQMLRFIKELPHQEALIFEYPQYFTLKEEISKKKVFEKEESEEASSLDTIAEQLAKLIMQEINKHQYLIVEDSEFPVSNTVVMNSILESFQSGKLLMISVNSNDQVQYFDEYLAQLVGKEEIGVLKSPYYYLHRDAFEKLIDGYDFSRHNQQEIIVIASTIYWNAMTETGDLQEINSELDIDALINKYTRSTKQVKPNYYYNQARTKSYQKAIIITNHYDLIQALNKNRVPEAQIDTRHLVITNLSNWIEVARNATQSVAHISNWFTKIRSYIDEFSSYPNLQNKDIFIKGNQLVHSLSEFIKYLETYALDQVNVTQQHQTLSLYLSAKTHTYVTFKHLLHNVYKAYKDLYLLQQDQTVFINPTQERFKATIAQNYHILSKLMINIDNSFIIIKGELIHNRLYHSHVIAQTLQIKRTLVDRLIDFKGALLFSLGDYANQQSTGNSVWLNQPAFTYIQLPKISHTQQYNIHIPIGYIPSDLTGSDFQNELALNTTQFIEDEQDIFARHILIIANSQKQLNDLYIQTIHNDTLLNNYVIQAKGKHGSLRKIKRRAYEAKQSITIIDFEGFFDEEWELSTHKLTIFIQRLPFKSPDQPLIQAIKDQMDKDIDYFQALILPQMIQELKELLARMDEMKQIEAVYLFDDRVFTKYYSSTIQEKLMNRVNFQIFD